MPKAKWEFNKQEFSKGVQAAADRMKLSAYSELENLAERIKKIAAFETPIDTGETAASWYVSMKYGASGPEAKIANRNNKIAYFLEYGTRPHEIKVRTARVLADEEGNVFGTRVFHPGTRAYKMLSQAIMELGYTFDGVKIKS